MNANINEDELKLLAYLHEHATGYSEEFQLDPNDVAAAIEVPFTQLWKDTSYLSEKGLVGMRSIDASSSDGPAYLFTAVWLTGAGEDYMRELEAAPSVGRRVTVAVVKEMGAALRNVAIGVLTNMIRPRG